MLIMLMRKDKNSKYAEIGRSCGQLVQKMNQEQLYLSVIKKASLIYQIKKLSLESISPQRFSLYYSKYLERACQENEQNSDLKGTARWAMNECRLFAWICLAHAHVRQTCLQLLTSYDYDFLHYLFPNKEKQFLIYTVQGILKQDQLQLNPWEQAEIALLRDIMSQSRQTRRWSHVSFQLFTLSQHKYYRCSSQCREMWVNHLDRKVIKQRWSPEDDLLLFSQVVEKGTKWAHISRLFRGARTEHMTKNRYHSVLQKYRKQGFRGNQTTLVQKIIEDRRAACLASKLNQQQIVEQSSQMEQQEVKAVEVLAVSECQGGLFGGRQFDFALLESTGSLLDAMLGKKEVVVGLREVEQLMKQREVQQVDQWFNDGILSPLL